MNLFVANISRNVNQEALKALFGEFGEISSVKLVNDKYTGTSKGFGFIEVPTDIEAFEAINKLNNANFFGKNLVVSKVRPDKNRY